MNKVIKNSLSLLILFTAVTVVNASDDAEMAAVGAAARDIMACSLGRAVTGAISPSVTAARAAVGGAVAASELVVVNPRVAELESALAAAQIKLKKAQTAGKWQLVFHKMARKNLTCKMHGTCQSLLTKSRDLRAQVTSLSADSRLGALTSEEASVAADLLRAPMIPAALSGFGDSISDAGASSAGRIAGLKRESAIRESLPQGPEPAGAGVRWYNSRIGLAGIGLGTAVTAVVAVRNGAFGLFKGRVRDARS